MRDNNYIAGTNIPLRVELIRKFENLDGTERLNFPDAKSRIVAFRLLPILLKRKRITSLR